MIELTPEANELLNYLHRGGGYGYYWLLQTKQSIWFTAGQAPKLPIANDCYFGIHPAAEKGKTSERSKTSTIKAINCLFCEFDAKDFAGGKAEALEHINGLPLPPSVVIDSGGGYHAYWLLASPVPLANDTARELVKKLQAEWVTYAGGDPGAKDLARVLRVPGTLNTKYTPARPVSIVWADFDMPYELGEFDAILAAAAKNNPPKPTKTYQNTQPQAIRGNPAEYWLTRALEQAAPGSRNRVGFWLACQLRDAGLSEAEARAVQYPEHVTAGKRPYSRVEFEASVMSAYTQPARTPAGKGHTTLAEAPAQPVPNNPPPAAAPQPITPPAIIKTISHKTEWTAAELLAANFPAPKWAVPGLLPEGLSFLAGRPKLGKSWLALQIAHAVGTGGRVFDIQVQRGKVLYLALEDSPRRLQERMLKQGMRGDPQIDFRFTWQPFPEGGLIDLQNALTAGGYSLAIVDTFTRAIGRADQLDPAEMTAYIGNLQHSALSAGVSILLVDHHRKSNGFESSPVDDILGSTAKAAVADGALGLYRPQGKQSATLKITGRDVEEHELALRWDAITCCWQSLGDADAVREDSAKGEVMQAIRDLAEDGQAATTAKIAAYMGVNRGYVSHMLAELLAEGRVIKAPKIGREQPYVLP